MEGIESMETFTESIFDDILLPLSPITMGFIENSFQSNLDMMSEQLNLEDIWSLTPEIASDSAIENKSDLTSDAFLVANSCPKASIEPKNTTERSNSPFLYEKDPDEEPDEKVRAKIIHAKRCRNQRLRRAETLKQTKAHLDDLAKRYSNLRRRFSKTRCKLVQSRERFSTWRKKYAVLNEEHISLKIENDSLREQIRQLNH